MFNNKYVTKVGEEITVNHQENILIKCDGNAKIQLINQGHADLHIQC